MDIKDRARMAAWDIFPTAGSDWNRAKRKRAYEIILQALRDQRKEDLKTNTEDEGTDSISD